MTRSRNAALVGKGLSMCSVSGFITGLTAVSGMMSTMSDASARMQSLERQRQINNYNIAMANDNARISRLQAEDAKKQSEREEKEYRMELAQKNARQKAKYAASNVELTGSPAAQLVDNVGWGEYDAAKIREGGERKAWNYNVQANNYKNQANKLGMNNYSSSAGGIMSNIISGTTSAAKSLYGSMKF